MREKYHAIRKLDQWLLKLENALAGVFYVAMMVIVLVGVVMRYVLKASNLYGEEMSRYLMVACVYIGIAAGCRKRVHLNVTMFVNLLPEKIRWFVNLIVRAVVVAVYAFMTYQGVIMVRQMASFGQVSPAMRLPLWIMYTVITLGFALSTITEIVLYIHDFFFKGELLAEPGQKEGEEA